MELEPHGIVLEGTAGKSRPADRVLAFPDILFRCAAAIVELHHPRKASEAPQPAGETRLVPIVVDAGADPEDGDQPFHGIGRHRRGDVAAVTAVRQASIPLSVILGGVFLSEGSIVRRLIASLILALGIVLIVTGG